MCARPRFLFSSFTLFQSKNRQMMLVAFRFVFNVFFFLISISVPRSFIYNFTPLMKQHIHIDSLDFFSYFLFLQYSSPFVCQRTYVLLSKDFRWKYVNIISWCVHFFFSSQRNSFHSIFTVGVSFVTVLVRLNSSLFHLLMNLISPKSSLHFTNNENKKREWKNQTFALTPICLLLCHTSTLNFIHFFLSSRQMQIIISFCFEFFFLL